MFYLKPKELCKHLNISSFFSVGCAHFQDLSFDGGQGPIYLKISQTCHFKVYGIKVLSTGNSHVNAFK